MQPTKQRQTTERAEFFEILSISDPTSLIPVLEKGIEFMELISLDDNSCNDSLRDSRVLVAFLRAKRLGRLRKQLFQ